VRRLINLLMIHRRFRRALAIGTPLVNGRETKRVASAIRYDGDVAFRLVDGAVPFEPRETYADRVVEWATDGQHQV